MEVRHQRVDRSERVAGTDHKVGLAGTGLEATAANHAFQGANRGGADRELVVLLVSDTGVGIAAADLPTLFEPFHRGAHQHSAIEGAGIGLAVTRSLVELMGGRIDVVSVPGQGSTFSVTLAAA